ncbi:MAG TPA: hypothetical protein VLC54_08860 [Anaeromyxobacter sp.]|nr:hypothetical protein [Anaeromyxobacter sp.]
MHLAIEVLHEIAGAQGREERANQRSRERDDEGRGGESASPRRTGRADALPDDGRRLTVQMLRERWIVRGHRGDKATGGVTVKDRAAPS